ncbi:hypothetical protein S7711_10661 [Stachybotrys chartarum IBT 7711]|uniref:Uncharacterized protein n=1 Tax=Stachybotrys chartarum (strain CBS 109288 / IBT 7711) TaxID=1280523 RepID=A0A084B885_STACB|nr:hypothetical protein S7711_10661 [Stachybotrys chartarum IBT 7711]
MRRGPIAGQQEWFRQWHQDIASLLMLACLSLELFPRSMRRRLYARREKGTYQHRFPTKGDIAADATPYLFSMEDIHRAVCLMMAAFTRRAPGRNVISSKNPPGRMGPFPGYHDANIARPVIHGLGEIEDTEANFTIRNAMGRYCLAGLPASGGTASRIAQKF